MNSETRNNTQIRRVLRDFFAGAHCSRACSRLVAGMAFATVVGNPFPAFTQSLPAPITLNYSFTVPLAKAVPNPCTGGFVLMTGNLNVAITTVQGGADVYFKISGDFNSSGTGQDALATGALILNGTQKPNYIYVSEAAFESGFPYERPETFVADLSLRDYLMRVGGTTTDAFMMRTVLTLPFANGVPATPILQEIGVSCRQ